tara:strand:+ start:512 stop:703 length:192 start_codon:yes stop_codon:yes gene_type:complete
MSNIVWKSIHMDTAMPSYTKGEFERLHLCTFECEPLTDKEKDDIKQFKEDEREHFRRKLAQKA